MQVNDNRHIGHHRLRYDYHKERIKRARKRFCLLVRPWIEAAKSDEDRQERLWAASVRAVRMGLWKYPVTKHPPFKSRSACHSILTQWWRSDDPRWRDWANNWGSWHRWMSSQHWYLPRCLSEKYENRPAESA